MTIAQFASEARILWEAWAIASREPDGRGPLTLLDPARRRAPIGRFRGREFKAARVTKSLKSHARKLRQGKSFLSLGPEGEIRDLKEANLPRQEVPIFLEEGASRTLLNAPRKATDGLEFAIWCYFFFSELNGIRPFPGQERNIMRRSALFNDGGNFRQYINSLRKAGYLTRIPTDWSAKAVIHAAYGLRLAGNNRIRCPNFTRSDLVWELVKKFGSRDEIARLAYRSFLCAFRYIRDLFY